MEEVYTLAEIKAITETCYTIPDITQVQDIVNELILEIEKPVYDDVQLKVIRLMIKSRRDEINSWYEGMS